VRTVDQYAEEYLRLGLLEFRREYGRPVIIGLGIVGELEDRTRGRTGTLKMSPVSGSLPAQALVGRVWLVTKGPNGPKSPAIQGGRAANNDLVIPEFTISNYHFQFRYDVTRLVLLDLGSTNGTTVDGVRLTPGERSPITSGAKVVFGRYQFEFRTGPEFVQLVEELAGGPSQAPVDLR